MLAAIGLLALITFLLQVQSGDINPLAWFAKKPAVTESKDKAGAGKKGKAPPMIVFPADPLREAGEHYAAQRKTDLAEAESTKRGVYSSVAHMDSDAAAAMLAAMDQTAAVQLLGNLKQRELARIFDAAPPAQAALWAAALLNQPQLPAVPEAFKEQAKQAGVYDDTAELLQKYAADSAAAAGAATAPDAANPGAASGSATAPGTAAPGQTATPAPGASVLPGAYRAGPALNTGPRALIKQANTPKVKPPSDGKRAKAKAKAQHKTQRPDPPGTSNV